ncbi:allantoinase AllB [Chondromyces apiculatus]|uniref:allantoinase n=1 Tax=Chondromyces apiculatus DSM 436 TaxID=1192034 RepID=A0A017TA20_9BACT|nr:allantoinase AllB [Chondromyces apiculatus]EYF05670.1 Allantoinase [Chondromyces apiculatus DSM 436]
MVDPLRPAGVFDVVLKSRRVVLPDGVREAAVAIRGETIAAVLDPADIPPDARVIDVGDRVIMPGIVDTHAHINDPGRAEWEGFETATRACAAGGITTVVDMPLNSIPVTTTADALAQKLRAAEGRAFVDHGFWGGVVPGNDRDLEALVAAGALGFKAFLVHSGIDDFPMSTEADLRRAMPILAALKSPLLVHAEVEGAVADALASDPRDPRSYATYLASRPPSWEVTAVRSMASLCREHGGPVHIVHLSAEGAIAEARAVRAEGLPFSIETCPHYLLLAAEEIPDGRTEYKCAPPIRERDNRERLWTALADGAIDLVVSDHSPCTPALKLPEEGDFMRAWGGIASLQLGLTLIWTEASRRGFGLRDMVRWMCEAPARLAGLAHRKGRIAPGFDADLVVWDPEANLTLDASRLHHRHPVTPYLGRSLLGQVQTTYLRGRPIYDAGEIKGTPRGEPLLGRHDAPASDVR